MTEQAEQKHSLIAVNSGFITLLPYPNFPNLGIPTIHTPDDSQLYDVGTEYEFNGKAYFYARAVGTVTANLAVKVYNHQDVGYRIAVATSAVGATDISVTTTANDNLAGVAAKDELKGGVCVIFEKTLGAGYEQTFGIIGNDALAAYGTLKIYLDGPLTQEFTDATAYAEANASPWAKVANSGSTVLTDNKSVNAGVACCHATTGQWLWVQTWGMCWLSPDAALGTGTNNMDARFNGDGSLSDGDDTNTTVIAQRAGWVLRRAYGGGQGTPFVYLMIANKWMSAQPADTIEDFDNVYDFKTTFKDQFAF